MNKDQLLRVEQDSGFIAALDQSGGSTPKALKLYGVEEDAYSGDVEMMDVIHAMRSRIIKSPSFTSDKVLGAILFEATMDRDIDGVGSAEYLWDSKGVVPFLKVDKGLADEAQGVQLMKPMADLDDLCKRANGHGVFGTKMRSVIKSADQDGIRAIVDQQFEVGRQILSHGLVPILEPEVDIFSADKETSEAILRDAILEGLGDLGDERVMLKLSIPSVDDFYRPLVEHPNVLRVVALSGGYSREEANERLSRNSGVIASFSRALTEGLSAQQSDAEFDATLATSIDGIFAASA
ncbi:MAG TPA: fructose bisphosphate aldolase [Nocardioidaceae bacterium]|nr:fructose bisphosphate aldolase [Nocardioidaceae bacterium]